MEDFNNRYKDLIFKRHNCNGNDLIHNLVKDSRKDDYFNLLKEYLKTYPDKVNLKNEDGWTPLMVASTNSNFTSTVETVELLLESGADPNLQNDKGFTALMYASKFSITVLISKLWNFYLNMMLIQIYKIMKD